jgi:hypothetical protein
MGVLSRVLATIGQSARRRASLRCTTCGLACGNDEDVGQNSSSRTYGRVSRSSAEPRLQWLGDMYIPWEKQVGCVICCLNPWRQAVTPPPAVIIITFLSSSAKSPKFRLPPVPLFLCSSTSIASFRAVQARGRLGGRNLVKIWAGIITWPAGACEPPPQGSNPSL